MVMSSHQIAAMAMQQQAMFGNQANYAQQITPPGGMFGGYGGGPMPGPPPPPGVQAGYGGMSPQGGIMSMAAQLPYQMPGQFIQQGMAEQITGGVLGMGSGALSGASNLIGGITGAAGLATMGFAGAGAIGGMASGAGMMAGAAGGMATLGALPMGGAVLAAGGMGAMGVGALAAGGAYAGDQIYQGFRERQDVGRVMRQRFGGQMGVGGGRGGMGFSGQEVGQMSSMMRGMAAEDMFTSFDELTRTLDKTSQMGLFRGVQSAAEFREKFKTTVNSLKEIAKTMHTSLDEAAGFMEQQRNQGYFSGQDINRSLMRTRMNAGASGMSVQQMQQIGQQGTMMGRSMGMLGRTGAEAMQETAANMGVAMQMGFISDQDIAEATGGLTGAEGAQAYAARQMQTNRRWLKKGPGRVMLAGLWDKEGGIDKEMMNRAMSGDISIGELRSQGRRNISATGGRQSEFFLNENRLGGELMAQGGGDLMLGVVGEHFARKKGIELEDPIMQRWLQKYSGRSQSEVELAIKQFRKMPEILQAKNVKFAQQQDMEGRTRARELSGVSGFSRRIGNIWEKEVTSPLKQIGDDIQGAVEKGISDIVDQMEGSVSTAITERARNAQVELRSTGKGGLLGRTLSQDRTRMAAIRRQRSGTSSEGGFFAGVGRALGMRSEGLDARLEAVGADSVWTMGSAKEQEKIGYLKRDAASFARAQQDLNLSATEQAELTSSVGATLLTAEAGALDDFSKLGGLMPVSGAQNFAAIQKDIEYLEQHNPEFRDRARGKSRHEKIALYEATSGDVSGTSLARRGYGGGGTDIASLRNDLAALQAQEKDATVAAGKFFRGVAGAKGILKKEMVDIGGGDRPMLREQVVGDVHVGALMQVSKGNKTMSGYLTALSDPNASDEDREAAILGLRKVGKGGAKDELGINVSENVQRTARAIAEAADSDREGTEEALSNIYETESIKATIVSDDIRRKQARKLEKYIGKRSNLLDENVEKGALADFRELVKARTKEGGSVDLDKMEEDFLMKHAHTEAGANLLATLGNDPSTVYQSGSIRRMRAWVNRAGGSDALEDTASGARSRVKAVLKDSLGAAGLSLKSLGKNREERRRWERKIQSGKVTAGEVMEQLRATAGGKDKLQLAEGVTTGALEEHLGGLVKDVKSGGKFSAEEFLQRGADAAQRESERERSGGGDKTMEDLPSLAQKQVDHLANMVKLTNTIALNSGNSDLIAAVEKLDIGGKDKKKTEAGQ